MRLAVALLLLAACAGRAATVRTSQPSDSRGPATVDPAVPAFEMGMMDHVTLAGWSADGAEFALPVVLFTYMLRNAFSYSSVVTFHNSKYLSASLA